MINVTFFTFSTDTDAYVEDHEHHRGFGLQIQMKSQRIFSDDTGKH